MSLFRRSSPPARIEPAPTRSADPPIQEVTLVVQGDRARAALIERAESSLPKDEVLVQVKDLVGQRRSFQTMPIDARARLVAREPPVVLRGGLTSLVAYYRVPADALQAREEHFENGKFSHAYDVTLRVVGRGRAQTPAALVNA